MIFGYEELKEYVNEDFNRFFNRRKFTSSQVIPAILDEYEDAKDYSETEECVIYVDIALNFIMENISLGELAEKLNLLFSEENLQNYKNDIKNDFILMENDINFIKKHLNTK